MIKVTDTLRAELARIAPECEADYPSGLSLTGVRALVRRLEMACDQLDANPLPLELDLGHVVRTVGLQLGIGTGGASPQARERFGAARQALQRVLANYGYTLPAQVVDSGCLCGSLWFAIQCECGDSHLDGEACAGCGRRHTIDPVTYDVDKTIEPKEAS